MRVAIVGAGGVGGYFGGTIARAGHEVRLFARGENRDAIRSRGLEVRKPEGAWNVAVVATPLLNGVEAFESLAAAGVAADRMLAGLAVVSAEKTAPGIITRKSDFRSVVVGERQGGVSERAERIATLFREAGADARVSEDIAVDLWRKFLFLTTIAAACGLARAPIGAVREAPLGPELLERAGREIAAVARARGVALPAGEEDKVLQTMADLPAGLKPSFLLDLERGGPNELDILSGAVSRYGRACGVPTPIHDTAVAALCAAADRRG